MRTALPALAVGALLLSGCQLTESNQPDAKNSTAAEPVTVTSTDDACTLSATSASAGHLVFRVTNKGKDTTEFYLYAGDGKRVVGEVENITPGLTRDLVVAVKQGEYVTACKPGMSGKGIRADFEVTPGDEDAGIPADVAAAALESATEGYAEYVRDEAAALERKTVRFVSLYTAGRDRAARELYPRARVHWERIETVAESFGDLDPRMDAREADLEPGQKWTGWHAIEKDLWPPREYAALSQSKRKDLAGKLLADTRVLRGRLGEMEFTVDQIGNGSKGLLDEVATGKITGEEEIWSHTDLYDFQANVDGAEMGFELLESILVQKDAELAEEIEHRFDELNDLLKKYRRGKDGFVSYASVGEAERKQLSDAVNALSEPLSKLTGAIAL